MFAQLYNFQHGPQLFSQLYWTLRIDNCIHNCNPVEVITSTLLLSQLLWAIVLTPQLYPQLYLSCTAIPVMLAPSSDTHISVSFTDTWIQQGLGCRVYKWFTAKTVIVIANLTAKLFVQCRLVAAGDSLGRLRIGCSMYLPDSCEPS